MTTRGIILISAAMMQTASELRTLAIAYMDATGITAIELSQQILGRRGHHKLIQRLLAGHGCAIATGERASRWFREHWPVHVPWPSEVRERSEAAE